MDPLCHDYDGIILDAIMLKVSSAREREPDVAVPAAIQQHSVYATTVTNNLGTAHPKSPSCRQLEQLLQQKQHKRRQPTPKPAWVPNVMIFMVSIK